MKNENVKNLLIGGFISHTAMAIGLANIGINVSEFIEANLKGAVDKLALENMKTYVEASIHNSTGLASFLDEFISKASGDKDTDMEEKAHHLIHNLDDLHIEELLK